MVLIYSPLYCVLDRLYPLYLDSLHEFDQTTKDLHNPWPNRRGGMSRHPAPAIGLKVEAVIASAEIDAELVCPWVHPAFHQERTVTITRDTTSLKEWANVWSPDKKPKAKFNEYHEAQGSHDEIYTDGSNMNAWGQGRSSTAISRMVRLPAANCLNDCQTTAPSFMLRLQPSLWHWTITDTWVQFIMKL